MDTLSERGCAYAEARYTKRQRVISVKLDQAAQAEDEPQCGGAVIVYKHGQPVGRSRNLRGLLNYARRSPVSHVSIRPLAKGQGLLRVLYRDGAYSSACFASFLVLKNWTRSRRSWPSAEVLELRS